MGLKRLLTCMLVGGVALTSLAVPAKRGLRSYTQPDGTVITLNLIGDEHFHTLCTTDGLAVVREADGYFYYRGANGVSAVKAHDIKDRDAAEMQFVAQAADSYSVSGMVAARRTDVSRRRAAAAGPQKASQVPSTGSPRVPIILVQYADKKFKDADAKATFTSFFTEGDKSAHQYFVDQSNGKYTPQFDVYGPFTLSQNRSAYGGNDDWGDDKGVGKMVAEGCLGLASEIDYSLYDNDGDGECDVVIVLYAGDGEASSYDDDYENAVWPMQWNLLSSDYGKVLNINGIKINKFAVFNELNGTNLSKIDGIGTFCHEFSHCLALPDFYDTNYSGKFGMAKWSLLDNGCYNDDGYTPVGYTAYEKAFMGWIDIEEATEDTYYTLPVFNQKNPATDRAIKITNPADKNEYFIIENRANQGWDKYMPAEGLLIYHVTYNATAWAKNEVNDYDLQRMTPVPADNDLKMDKEVYWGQIYYLVNEASLKGDLWPYGYADSFTDTTKPASKFNSGVATGKPVTNITRNADGTVSFWFAKAPLPAVAVPVLNDYERVSPTSITIHWTAGDANDVTYTLDLREYSETECRLISSTDFSVKSHGWKADGYTITSDDATRIGSANQTGSLQSPVFETGKDGKVTVKFTARSYNTDNSSVVVSLLDASNNELASETVQLTAINADYNVVLQGTADSEVSVKFATTGKKKRVLIVSADIYTGDATDFNDDMQRAASLPALITGIRGTSYTVDGLKADGKYNYRLKAVPVDPEAYSESDWSLPVTIDLAASGIVDIATDAQPAEYYNLQGVRVNPDALVPGIYIVKQGTATGKVVVR